MTVPRKTGIGKIAGTARRQPLSSSQQDWVKLESLESGPLPLVLRPAIEGVNLIEWARAQRGYINDLLLKHRALLFRGFSIRNSLEFRQFAEASSSSAFMEYRDRSTPRLSRGNGIYTSTIYPAEERINLHNEGTYWTTWPLLIYFCCLRAPDSGGATPIADVSNVYNRVDAELRERFSRRQVMYVRNYNEGFGLPWQEVFQTNDPSEVENYCRTNGIEFEWKDQNRLRTRQVRPAVRTNPRTGQPVWFNHAAFFHVTALEPKMREALQAEFADEDLPYNTYFGDGGRIEPEEVAHILDAYKKESIRFPWREGDTLMMDNMSVAHGRESYSGEREVLTALLEPFKETVA